MIEAIILDLKMKIKLHHFIAAILVFTYSVSSAQKIATLPADGYLFINPEKGSDHNAGSKDNPLKTLFEAARRINDANGKGALNVILAEGIYGLDATVTFHPYNWHFSKSERLTIRAESLPDDADWNPGKMPVIISTMPLNFKPMGEPDPGTSYGIQIEMSYVTIQGLRVLGTPVHETPKIGDVKRNYPIVREGLDLDDLRITQCLFVGDRVAIPNHLAILASGQGVVVDHCVFYKVKDAVVFFLSNKPAERCEMHHNLIIDNYGGAVWSWSAAEDFKYYNNVVSGTNIFWILNKDGKNAFKVNNSMIIGYNELVKKGGGAKDFGEKADPSKVKFGNDVIIKKTGKIEIDQDQTSRNYLQIKPGTLGSNIGAGLFTK